MPQHSDNGGETLEKLVQRRLQQLPVFARELLAGGAAGGLAKTCVAPLERTKIIFQTRGGQMTVGGVIKHIWSAEGVPGLFRGNTASVLRIVPYAAIHFGSYEYIRRFVVQLAGAEDGHGPDAPSALPVYDLVAGSASGAIAVVATYPLDLVRTRLAWETESPAKQQPATAGGNMSRGQAPAHPGIWSTLRGTVAEEGMAGLYRGCAPTLLGILPYAGLKFYVYQAMKNSYRSWQIKQQAEQQADQQQQQLVLLQAEQQQQQREGDIHAEQHPHLHPPAPPFETALQQVQVADVEEEEEQLLQQQQQPPQKLPVAITLLFGGVAGLVAQTVTYPLDVIRRQMQVAHLQLLPQATTNSSRSSSSGSSRSVGTSGAAPSTPPAHPSTGGQQLRSTSVCDSSSAGRAVGVGPGTPSGQGAQTHSLHSISTTQPGAAAAAAPNHATHQRRPVSATTSTAAPGISHPTCHSTSSGSRHVPRGSCSIPRQLRGLSSSRVQPATATAAAAAAEPSMLDVAVRLWRQGGMFRGLSINYLKVVPSTAIGFTVYDYMKAYLGLTHT